MVWITNNTVKIDIHVVLRTLRTFCNLDLKCVRINRVPHTLRSIWDHCALTFQFSITLRRIWTTLALGHPRPANERHISIRFTRLSCVCARECVCVWGNRLVVWTRLYGHLTQTNKGAYQRRGRSASLKDEGVILMMTTTTTDALSAARPKN